MQGEASTTAIMAAMARAIHRIDDDHPWVLDDPYAQPLVGAQWDELRPLLDSIFAPPVQQVIRGGLAARSRYAEDRFLTGGTDQYVLLGAGLDSFAWRRPDVLRRAKVFEVDHPLTQAWKRDRIAALHLPTADGPTFVPCDFEHERLHDGLEQAGFDWGRPATFSWTGVSMYLTVPAIEETLRTIASGAAGTEIVLSYSPPREELDELSRAFLDVMTPLAASRGEPIQSFFEEQEIVALVKRCGLDVADHPSHGELNERYLSGRADGLRTYMCERMLAAIVS